MTETQFEFINSSVNCAEAEVNVKEEPVVIYETFASNNRKCGEIFAANSGNFILICGFCQHKFVDMLNFGSHISINHPDDMPIVNYFQGSKIETSHSEDTVKVDTNCHIPNLLPHDVEDSLTLESDSDSIQNYYNNSTEELDVKESESYSCSICDRSLESLSELNDHCQKHLLDNSNDVQQTPMSKVKREKKPRKRKEKITDSDDQDDVPLTEVRNFLKDSKAVVDLTASIIKIPCDKCDRLFKSNRALAYHIARQHTKPSAEPDPNDPQYLRCKYCNQEFPTRPDCQEHEKTHNEEKPFLCWHCNLAFKTTSGRKRHVRIHNGERPYQCEECPRSFENKEQLGSHIHKHKNPRKFTCQTCGESFFRRFQLGLHEQRRHTGFRPLVCEDCGKSFVTMGELTQHRIRHSDVKDWKCEVCGKCFYSKWALKDHMACHSDAKPFGCDVCGRWFSRPKALKKHKKLHSDVKTYVCNICGKAYAQDSGLYAHKKTHGINSSK